MSLMREGRGNEIANTVLPPKNSCRCDWECHRAESTSPNLNGHTLRFFRAALFAEIHQQVTKPACVAVVREQNRRNYTSYQRLTERLAWSALRGLKSFSLSRLHSGVFWNTVISDCRLVLTGRPSFQFLRQHFSIFASESRPDSCCERQRLVVRMSGLFLPGHSTSEISM